VAAERATALSGSIAARALGEARVYATWDVRQSATVSPAVVQAAVAEGIASVACAPMFAHGRALGVLNLYCRAPQHCFSPDQFQVLSLLAAQGAVALANARLYEKSRVQAREVQASFARVGSALASSLDIGQTLRLIVQLAGEMTRADGGAMFMLDDVRGGGLRGRPDQEGGGGEDDGHALPTSVEEVLRKPTELTLSAARGLHRRSIRLFRRVPLSSLAERALRGRKVIVVPDTRRHPDVPFPSLRVATAAERAASEGGGAAEDEPETTRPVAAAAAAPMLPARSAVCVPVLVGDRPVGVLEQYAAEPRHFTTADVQLLESFALQAAVAIENARLYGQEKNLAQTLQRAFLPDLPDTVGGLEIGRIYVPASDVAAVGGDIYDLLPLPDGRIALMIADVCGHGLHAATLTALAKHTARAYALLDPDPAVVLSRLNDALCVQTGDYTFLTVCYALLDGCTGHIAVASAAHPPLLLCRAGGGCVRLGPSRGCLPASAAAKPTRWRRPRWRAATCSCSTPTA
jgi:GAF domain-containing protein